MVLATNHRSTERSKMLMCFLIVVNFSLNTMQWLIRDPMSNVKAHVQAQKLLGARAIFYELPI